MIVKESGSTKETPWHQDQAYYEIDGQQVKPFFLVTILVSKFCYVLEDLRAVINVGHTTFPNTKKYPYS